MGPCVKFVSCINGSFSKKKGVIFFIRKKTKPGGGVGLRDVLQKTTIFT